MVSGINSFLQRSSFCNEVPLHTIGPCFIVISGAIMSQHGNKKILMQATDEKQVIYKTYIRPHVEHCIQAWSPCLVKDINLLEKNQHCATKLIPELINLNF